MARWFIKGASGSLSEIAQSSKVSPLIARLLLNRGVDTAEKAEMFLNGGMGQLRDPFIMKDMRKGAGIIRDAILEKKRIVIYGDYDADGVTSTAILKKALERLGAQVSCWIPHREEEGYGMNPERVRILREEGAEVILTCDNGISSFEEIGLAKRIGMQVVVTDHHDIPVGEHEGMLLPPADAIINPHRRDEVYQFSGFSGAGIAYKFSSALFSLMGASFDIGDELLELSAIGTICDVVDLSDENRIIAREGLNIMNRTRNKGLQALIKASDLEGKTIGAYHIGFIIGPCINATGRLESARLALELLTTENMSRAFELAVNLVELNTRRQELTTEALESVLRKIGEEGQESSRIIVVYDRSVHESIAGIVAGRVKEMFSRPAIVLTGGRDNPKGSGRSIEEFNMIEAIRECDDILLKYGGHPMACGLSIEEGNIETFRSRLNSNCSLKSEDLVPKISIDVPLRFDTVTMKDIGDISALEPYGKGNPSPVFGDKGVEVVSSRFIGREKNHVKLSFRRGSSITDGIWFNGSDRYLSMVNDGNGISYTVEDTIRDVFLDLVYYPDINEYNGNRSIQLNVKDARVSGRNG
jgi:single-stranded-DNA-specific exonuclease